ncbi:DUF4145 domain-containing protein [Sphingomonas sp. LB-2]|uniref:DUF4145 domain-containing protein n=1 Tax=Sphingomonas caeni TaxID=2984949 RepID=UPI0022329E52|nr:DUF4145 domain-containing protein [Sphingomonas caeni]MCW3846129.1 DUF4145 domain-containing protein [Sphingomonas caeni]
MEAIGLQSDRGAAVMLATMVEKALWVALMTRMPKVDKITHDGWFEGAHAPFQTFSAKIKLGRAFGIYGPRTEELLNTIREIRNAFAHALTPLGFDNPTIANACLGMVDRPPSEPVEGEDHPMRTRYHASCIWAFEKLMDDAKENGDQPILIKLP